MSLLKSKDFNYLKYKRDIFEFDILNCKNTSSKFINIETNLIFWFVIN